jgi:hypothetical protein
MTLRKIALPALVLSSALLLIAFAPASGNPKAAVPAGRPDLDRHCVPIGGTVMTNFGAIDASTTMGTATGDLRGAVSGTLLGLPQPGAGGTLIFHVQHHWVTEAGDTLFFDPATATTAPLPHGLFAILTYPVHLTGGTGKFAGATGDITNIGEVSLPNAPDVTGGTTIFRYTGQVCFDRD